MRAGGGPYIQQPGVVIGTASDFDLTAVEKRLLLETEYVSGAKIRRLTTT